MANMKPILTRAFVVCLVFALASAAFAEQWQLLFDGKTLEPQSYRTGYQRLVSSSVVELTWSRAKLENQLDMSVDTTAHCPPAAPTK